MATFTPPADPDVGPVPEPYTEEWARNPLACRLRSFYQPGMRGRNVYILTDNTVTEDLPAATYGADGQPLLDAWEQVAVVFWGGHVGVEVTAAQVTLLTDAGYGAYITQGGPMPTYLFRCEDHGEFERWLSIHDDAGRASVACPECNVPVDQVMTPPLVSATVMSERKPEVNATLTSERQLDEDRAAYRRLRDDGVQPKQINGSAHMERHADTETEINMGKILPFDKVKAGADISAHVVGHDVADA